MNIFKKIFGLGEVTKEKCTQEFGHGQQTSVQVSLDVVKVEAVKPKVVSEPIVSFVECVKANPKRFNLVYLNSSYGYYLYHLVDKKEDRTFAFSVHEQPKRYAEASVNFHAKSYNNFISRDEEEYIITNLKHFYEISMEKRERLQELKRQRKNRQVRKELMGVYCK